MDEEKTMPITSGLRDAVHRYNKYSSMTMPCESQTYVKCDADTFDHMCDAIDAIHKQLELDYKVACRVNECQDQMYTELRGSTLKLPRDKDKKTIDFGDRIDHPIAGQNREVVGILYDAFGVGVQLDQGEGGLYTADPKECTHHPESWETIIGDALDMDIYSEIDMERLVARCKALAEKGGE